MAPVFHNLKVARAIPETQEAVSLTLDVPSELRGQFRFLPGQHVILRAAIDGIDTRRNYSITSGPDEPISVAIRWQKQGRFSTFARTIRAGDEIQATAPAGRFVYSGERSLLLVAAGSGITPILSIAKHALEAGANVVLLYGNRTSESTMFKAQLSGLKDQNLSNFSLFHVLSRQSGSLPALSGRIDTKKVRLFARNGIIDTGKFDGKFICGPGSMIQDVADTLSELGFDRKLIHFERFAPPGRRRPAPQDAPAAGTVGRGVRISAVLDGVKREFTMEDGDGNVLAAALRQGIELPHSCRGGMCCTCRCHVIEGGSEMEVNYSLQPWELEAGFTLACQTRPTGDRLSLDFDAI